jgi:hypothetical protein
VDFELIATITNVEAIAEGAGVRIARLLRTRFGGRRWRKMKGTATGRLADGRIREAEIHWYEAHGIGRKRFKIKRLIP